ncbi:HAD family hydrolase [Nocardia brasiliensis]|uniref:HAD family hydrolase n=1 Tax=Nocardia brasiliensis TaxID=37326 RepID=UPI002456F2B6|nr:HAD family hydrolase [Nocardia brasiliensis]
MAQVRSNQFVLPFFDVFVFFDWYNTLSTAAFWDSIVLNDRHPLSAQLRDALEELFRGRKDYVRGWMRGAVTDAEVIATLNVTLPATYRDDYLLRKLLGDCKSAQIDPEMMGIVRELRQRAFLAVASDNMDCFVHAAPKVLTGELRIDELIVSSEVGSLKKESPQQFFGPTLERYGLDPARAILIDDCADTCEEFRSWGGHAFHFTTPATLRDDISSRWPITSIS